MADLDAERRRAPNVACDIVGCANPAVVVVGTGRRLFGRQRLDQLRLLCELHAATERDRRLFAISVSEWLSSDLTRFQRRWHRPAELDEYLASRRERES